MFTRKLDEKKCCCEKDQSEGALSTYVIIFNQRHHSSGLRREEEKRSHVTDNAWCCLSPEAHKQTAVTQYQRKLNKSISYQVVIPAVEVVSVPEPSLVASDVAHLAPLVLKVRLPHQRPVPEDPQAGLRGDDVLRLHFFKC